ncbi:hypothetical protein PG984_006783 [Apiospora sp. TS-2023a]
MDEINSGSFTTSPSPSSTDTGPGSAKMDGTKPPVRLVVFSHELPSGDVRDLFRRLHRYAKRSRHPLLARFLRSCVSVLREEVRKLPRGQRGSVPPFGDVITLGSEWETLRNGPIGGAWEGAFVCIYELAMLIGHQEEHASLDDGEAYETFNASCLAGISIGLFSAASVAVSRSLADLVLCGAEAVRMAFVFCLHVGRVSQLLESPGDIKDNTPTQRPEIRTWAAVITGLPAEVVQAELDRFNDRKDPDGGEDRMTTPLTRISISHVDRASVGITGPPARLTELFRQSQALGAARHAALPISGGLCHVPNVYDDEDVRTMLESARVRDRWGSRAVQKPLLSPHTGAAFAALDAYQLIEAICTEALTLPLFFDKVAEGAAMQMSDALGLQMASSCQILHYRTSSVSDTIISTVAERLSPSTAVQLHDLADWVMQEEEEEDYSTAAADATRANPELPQDSKLAIVGMACRLPGDADTPDRFWELLVQGRDTLGVVPPDRFDIEAHLDLSGETENAVGTRFGNFISNPGHFDARFFNMSPRERLALVTAYEALEMAGFVANRTPSSHVSRVGTYYGQASDDYREVNANQKIGTYGIPGTERAFGNGRIHYFFGFQGPSLNVDTACSSSLAAIHVACSALWAGDADTVVAGGLNVITSPDIYCMLGKGHFLSPTGQCKVWDAGADGYCRSDGVGSVVIKRLQDALADNDVVLGTILAAGTNHSSESVSITQPHAGAQQANYRRVLDRAGVDPLDVGYVELHGTGTQVGDAVDASRGGGPGQRLHLGALKSNMGHCEAAAGVASLIKVLLMYRHGTIPRHIGIKTTVNPAVARHLADRNAGVVLENTPWVPAPGTKRRYSIVNSFGAHGGNTTLLLEDAPPSAPIIEPDVVVERDGGEKAPTWWEVVCLSAKSKASLRGNAHALLRYLEAHPETRLRDVAYTTCARRMHHHLRVAQAVSSTTQLRDFLRAVAHHRDLDAPARQHVSSSSSSSPRVVVFAFSGQGAYYRGAAASLFGRAPEFRDMVRQLDRVVRQLGFPSVLASLTHVGESDGCTTERSGNASSESPLVTQLALVVLQIALAQYWELLGIAPHAVVGHSLGEYAALVSAGVLSVADALFLVGKRAELMLAACEPGSHAMLSVRGASPDRIAELCREHKEEVDGEDEEYRYQVSCINGLADIVVSGAKADMCSLRDMLRRVSGLQCTLLDVPFAFHSAQLDPILDDFESSARRVTFKAPRIPIISPLLGQCVRKGQQVIDETYLRRATREAVDFVSGVHAAVTEGLVDDGSIWIDIGPHPVCTTFVRHCHGQAEAGAGGQAFPSLRRADGALAAWSGSLAALHGLGLPVAWNEYFRGREAAHRLLPLDPYQWNQRDYWIPYQGTWTLDKANAARPITTSPPPTGVPVGGKDSIQPPAFFTSSVQQVAFQDLGGRRARLTAVSDLFHPDLLQAAAGHKINGRSVFTASIWADICLTVGEEVHKRLVANNKIHVDLRDMEVVEAQMLPEGDPLSSAGSSVPPPARFVRVEALLDLSLGQSQVSLYAAARADGTPQAAGRAFATATVGYYYQDAQAWQAEGQTVARLVASRIDAIWGAAAASASDVRSRRPVPTPQDAWEMEETTTTTASVLSRHAAYQLFGNMVDYGARYRGMRRVALVEGALEATADVVLDADRHGTWHTPPHWIDGAFQLAGFVMNSFGVQGRDDGDEEEEEGTKAAGSSRDFFYITPGWRHLRLAEPLEPGPQVRYRNYVRMCAVDGEPGAYTGDVYLLRGVKVVGVCAGIRFKRVPRAMMPIMFPRRQEQSKPPNLLNNITTLRHQEQAVGTAPIIARPPSVDKQSSAPETGRQGEEPRVAACIQLIASEMGLAIDDVAGDATFADLGVDSLMSLTLAEKIQAELGIKVKASVFLECSSVQDLESWLAKHLAS